MDPSGNVCWEGCHGARAGMSRVFLLESQMDDGGGEQTCPPPDSGPYLGFLSFMRGGGAAGVSTAVTGVGLRTCRGSVGRCS